MDSVISIMKAEREELVRKLAAIDQLMAAYGVAPASGVAAPSPFPTFKAKAEKPRRAAESKIDKFGSYGTAVIEASLRVLPNPDDGPMMTRDVVERLASNGMEVRGENKVNALSAMLARSSKVKSYGRSGWTRVEPRDDFDGLIEDDASSKENEPISESAVGSDAGERRGTSPDFRRWINPHPGPAS